MRVPVDEDHREQRHHHDQHHRALEVLGLLEVVAERADRQEEPGVDQVAEQEAQHEHRDEARGRHGVDRRSDDVGAGALIELRRPTKTVASQVATIVRPIPAMPSSLPIMISFGVTEESRTSTIRFDFSSIVLLSSICMTVKIEIQSR